MPQRLERQTSWFSHCAALRTRRVRLVAAAMTVGVATACAGGDDGGGTDPYSCTEEASACLHELAGDYVGTYSGDTRGTWKATLTGAGTLQGMAHNDVIDADFELVGSADEAGRMVFGTSSDGNAFSGRVAEDFTVAGIWSLDGHSGTFEGRRTSALADVGEPGAGGTGSGEPGCLRWPQSELFPLVGPFFYGPNPGPCTLAWIRWDVADDTDHYEYDADGRLTGSWSDLGVEWTYTYTGDLIDIASGLWTDGTVDTETYTFHSDSVVVARDTPVSSSEVTYLLGASGYPQSVTLVGGGAEDVINMTYEYEDCRLVARRGYHEDGTAAANYDLEYEYDEEGRIVRASNVELTMDIDYSCWSK
ncbi:MAG: hypothetical protein JW940_07875 [Polyangiaceae bacterium]|nr:hypothetical protein [Polyangiaceae bacterium]